MEIHPLIQSQYHASLDMLRQAIELCPPELWNRETDLNKFWHLAYHTLFYTHLYLHPTEDDFIPWEKHRPEMGALPGPPHAEPYLVGPYTQAEILEYIEYLRTTLDQMVNTTDLAADSGFYWLPFSKLELQFYNIRHIMQHTGELGERLGQAADLNIDWVSQRPKNR